MSTQPDFVEGKQKSFWERMFLNTGIVFISGWGIGSVTGFANGIRKSPSRRMKIVMNSGLNHAGRAGVKYGNMLRASPARSAARPRYASFAALCAAACRICRISCSAISCSSESKRGRAPGDGGAGRWMRRSAAADCARGGNM